ncbi:MAG: RloB family protein [Alphaproteobacteria bacterium]|nr:RloB family protein [Alphaproteobacteria bacterium]
MSAKNNRIQTDFTRPENTSKAKPVLLLLTEDKKSGKFYLEDFCKAYKLGAKIIHDASTPLEIADRAEKEIDNYDEIYCVFDRDKHEKFDDAVLKIKRLQKENRTRIIIEAIYSNISFELWYMLHFNYTTKSYISPNELVKDLKKIKVDVNLFKAYSKNTKGIHAKIKEQTDTAIKNSKALVGFCNSTKIDNPKTLVHKLVIRLREISNMN